MVDFGKYPRSDAIDFAIGLISELHLDEIGDSDLLQSSEEVVLIELIKFLIEFLFDFFLLGGEVSL